MVKIMKNRTLLIATLGVLTALAIVFKIYSIPLPSTTTASDKISLLYVPVFICAFVFRKRGWIYAFTVGFLADTIGFLINPVGGAYMPQYSIVVGLGGIISYLCTFKTEKIKVYHIVIAVLLTQLVCSIFLVSLLNKIYFAQSTPLWVMISSRLVKQPITIAIYLVALIVPINIINKFRTRFLKEWDLYGSIKKQQ